MWPTLKVLRQLGGSARIDEISVGVITMMGFTEEHQAVRRRPGDSMALVDYRLAWSRNYLKNIGAIENSARGVWSLTDLGRTIEAGQIDGLAKAWKRAYGKEYSARKRAAVGIATDEEPPLIEEADAEAEPADDWKSVLISRLLSMPPDGFERLAQRLLREAGFLNVQVLGKSGDGGIDGVGVYRLSLVSFPVFFQCKRYRGSVSARDVRDFRGAMSGRGEKGLLITTGTFTREARSEATRDGAPPVELVSGDDLCDLLKDYKLGVETRMVEEAAVVPSFFDQF